MIEAVGGKCKQSILTQVGIIVQWGSAAVWEHQDPASHKLSTPAITLLQTHSTSGPPYFYFCSVVTAPIIWALPCTSMCWHRELYPPSSRTNNPSAATVKYMHLIPSNLTYLSDLANFVYFICLSTKWGIITGQGSYTWCLTDIVYMGESPASL